MALHQHELAFIFGILGNIISFMVFLAPVPTFYLIYKKKTAERFQSYPYVVVALFSCMLWIYDALVKNNATLLLITINSYGIIVEVTYLAIFLFYAPKKLRSQLATIKLLLLLNLFGFEAILLSTLYLSHGNTRFQILQWIRLVVNISVFGTPLLIIREVIKTRSVEHMPLIHSMFLTVKAVMWFFYGLFLKDYFIAVANTLGFLFGA
ncbi:hypothetical protein QN277_025699 [Acacia crassicarpa]|uniref:Bidirectional sugar transporter SWEET n=1 Tax=Acacia crassicarpa TaxID=499986 RepID=A0AAE1JAE6_9FABA|nr:hypothetical protein QN277_025699 [Acacia crassicarpa]